MTLGVVRNLLVAASGLSPYGEALEYSTPYCSPLTVAKKLHVIILHNAFSHDLTIILCSAPRHLSKMHTQTIANKDVWYKNSSR